MSRERTTVLFIAVATLVALALNPTTAHAEKSKATDAMADVVVISGESDAPAPENTSADIAKSVVNHSSKRVRIKVKFVDLASGSDKASVVAIIKTNTKNYDLTLIRFKGLQNGFELTDHHGNTIRCPGKKKDLNTDADFIKLSVPRTCLNSPRWIRVGIAAVSGTKQNTFADDALRSEGMRKNGDLEYGPKLKRG